MTHGPDDEAPDSDVATSVLPTTDEVMGLLRGVIDPELGLDIVELGMAKGARIEPDGVVHVKVALTTSGCPHKPSKNPGEHSDCDLTDPREFNLMFKTHVGALFDPTAEAFLRPETAQGIFVNFKNVLDTSRVKLPFGIAQIGKSFRNEITPRNYTFRSREFEQMEIEFFCYPDQSQLVRLLAGPSFRVVHFPGFTE